MTSQATQSSFGEDFGLDLAETGAAHDLRKVSNRLIATIERDDLIRTTTRALRELLQVDRVVLYYFYRRWRGQVTFESLGPEAKAILGSTGGDDAFTDDYAAMYEAGRVRAIPDIELEPIQPCHRDFLRNLKVRANLVVPVLTAKGLWGLLIAHHCQASRTWSPTDLEAMQQAAETLAKAPAIQAS